MMTSTRPGYPAHHINANIAMLYSSCSHKHEVLCAVCST